MNKPTNPPPLNISNKHAQVALSLNGGQLLSYQPHAQEPILWLSQTAHQQPGKSIRGGIPICWPWFGAHPEQPDFPNHGFARTQLWQLDSTEENHDGSTTITLSMSDDPDSRSLWPHAFKLEQTITIGKSLSVTLTTTNLSSEPIEITEALHSYFHVGDAATIRISGLDNTRYFDKVLGESAVEQGLIRLDGVIDRAYQDTDTEVVIEDPVLQRRIRIAKSGSQSTVVWNPWDEWARRMDDFDDEGYRNMVCVETANALDNRVRIEPQQSHSLTTHIRVEAL